MGWRPLNGRPGQHMAVWLHVKGYGRGLSLRPTGCSPALSVTQKVPLQLQLRRYISVICHAFALL